MGITLDFDSFETSIGTVVLAALEAQLVMVDFADNHARFQALLKKRFGSVGLAPVKNPNGFTEKLEAYFGGDLQSLLGLRVSTGGTAFQLRVWQALREIPAGATWSYAQLAEHIGQAKAVRAVGMTNGLNPVSIVLPCHRVIGSNGLLTGYAGGLTRKRWLLEHEGARPKPKTPPNLSSTAQNALFD